MDWLVGLIGLRIDHCIGPNKGVESIESKVAQKWQKSKIETRTVVEPI